MLKRALPVLLLLPCAFCLNARTYYVAPGGADGNPGTLDLPFQTIARAASLVAAGDTISLRGGTYIVKAAVTLSRSGTSTSRISLLAYPGEHPVLDGDSMAVGINTRVIKLSGSYWTVRGLEIMRAGDNGMQITGSYNIIEECSFHDNSDTGLQLDNGASYNQVINCDSYNNADPSQGNADGFAAKLGVGTGNSFLGCRAWYNSDDGWDGYLRGADGVTTTLDRCWTFANGYLADGSASSGNGNGFKMGGSDDKTLAHNMILTRCLAFANRVKGFDQNNNRGSMTLLNCTGTANGTNYSVAQQLDSGMALTLKNCLCLGDVGSVGDFAVQATNSWMAPLSVTAGDFVSLDSAGVRAPRAADGSLPAVSYMHLAPGSDMIDAGTDVGLQYEGPAPDLGAFETDAALAVAPSAGTWGPSLGGFPNPFNPATIVTYRLTASGHVRLAVYDLLGREMALLVDAVQASGKYDVRFDGRGFPAGAYFCSLINSRERRVWKMSLVK